MDKQEEQSANQIDISDFSIALLSGTGRMGVHLAAAWAHAGMDVIICSRTQDKAQVIVDSLLAGKGYSSGDIMVPRHPKELPSPAQSWRLRAGSVNDAVSADIIVLSSPFHVAVCHS